MHQFASAVQATKFSSDEVIWSGWLYYCDLTSFFKSFKKHWAVLHPGSILIYNNKEDVKEAKYKVYEITPFSQVIDTLSELSTITNNFWVNKAVPNCFAVVSTRDTLLAHTDSPNEMRCWVAVIRGAIQRQKKERALDEEKKRLAECKLQREREIELSSARAPEESREQLFEEQRMHFEEQWKFWRDTRVEREEHAKDGSIYCVYHKCYHQITEEKPEDEKREVDLGEREATPSELDNPGLVMPSLVKKKFFVCQKGHCTSNCFCSACQFQREAEQTYNPSKPVQVNQLDESDIVLRNEIGSGSFSVVYRGEYHGKTVAVKRYISKVVSDPVKRNAVRREVGVLAASKGPYVVGLIGLASCTNSISVVLEYVRYGSLQRHIDQQKMNPMLRMKCILDTARGMKFLHSRGIIYRDLKPENLLLSSMDYRNDVCVKIADFGTGRKLPSKQSLGITKHVGTPIYMAPEILQGNDYSLPADVYSFAVTAWEIWTLNYAYDDYDTEARLSEAVCERKLRPELPFDDCPEEPEEQELPFALNSLHLARSESCAISRKSLDTSRTAFAFQHPSRKSIEIDRPETSVTHSGVKGAAARKEKPWFTFPKNDQPCDFPTPFAALLAVCWHTNPKERPPFWFIIEIIEDIYLELNKIAEA